MPLTKPLSKYQKNIVADALELIAFKDGEEIVKEGRDDGGFFYIIKEGIAKVFVGGKFIRDLVSKEYLGEVAILENRAPTATVTASGDVVVCRLDRENFIRLLGPLSRKFQEHSQQYKFYDNDMENFKADDEEKRTAAEDVDVGETSRSSTSKRKGSITITDSLAKVFNGRSLKLDDFEKLTQLGSGTYGKRTRHLWQSTR